MRIDQTRGVTHARFQHQAPKLREIEPALSQAGREALLALWKRLETQYPKPADEIPSGMFWNGLRTHHELQGSLTAADIAKHLTPPNTNTPKVLKDLAADFINFAGRHGNIPLPIAPLTLELAPTAANLHPWRSAPLRHELPPHLYPHLLDKLLNQEKEDPQKILDELKKHSLYVTVQDLRKAGVELPPWADYYRIPICIIRLPSNHKLRNSRTN